MSNQILSLSEPKLQAAKRGETSREPADRLSTGDLSFLGDDYRMADRYKRPVRLLRGRPLVVGKVAYIPLTRGYTAIIDAVDLKRVEGRNWHANVDKDGRAYASSIVPGSGKKSK